MSDAININSGVILKLMYGIVITHIRTLLIDIIYLMAKGNCIMQALQGCGCLWCTYIRLVATHYNWLSIYKVLFIIRKCILW